mmetsp:Transcript_6973/g.12892  ORF Transcript_6973/g.12892 Transcript_6973/m.12892 type:complete len:212 (-) Transcript_6973:2224-2859(-)
MKPKASSTLFTTPVSRRHFPSHTFSAVALMRPASSLGSTSWMQRTTILPVLLIRNTSATTISSGWGSGAGVTSSSTWYSMILGSSLVEESPSGPLGVSSNWSLPAARRLGSPWCDLRLNRGISITLARAPMITSSSSLMEPRGISSMFKATSLLGESTSLTTMNSSSMPTWGPPGFVALEEEGFDVGASSRLKRQSLEANPPALLPFLPWC